MSELIYLSDIIDTKPSKHYSFSPEERRAFVERVGTEMARLGFDKANELTEESSRLTGEDYRIVINY